MSEESLNRTGYFDTAAVRRHIAHDGHKSGGDRKFFSGMGLATVLATQLWHHLYLGGGLCELPTPGYARQPSPVLAAE